jgi:CRISPR-associated endonuclease/helicase Cas3
MLAPTGQDGQTLLDLLSDNRSGVKAYRETHRSAPPLSPVSLFQAFDTAESQFHALESDTVSVIVPYQEQGQKLVSAFLATEPPTSELFRAAQHYTVELNSSEFRRLDQAHAILPGAKGAVYLLQSNCYDSIKGIQTEPSAPEVLIF